MSISSPRILLAAFLLCSAGSSAAAGSLEPHLARYKIKISIASGTLETVVREADDGFEVRSVIEPTGLASLLMNGVIEERSQFTVDDSGVRPMVYASEDTLSKEDKFMDFVFDWEENEVNGTINDEAFRFELSGEAHDRVSIQYQLMHNLLTGSDSADYALLDGDELKMLSISTLPARKIKVPFGTFDAIGVRHQAADSKRVTTLWCAEELGYIPVLIEQHRRGKRRVRATLIDYQSGPEANSALSAN